MPEVVIRARDLDSDEETRAVVEIARVPDHPLRQEQELADLVAARHPDARQRSYANGVASFVAPQHLIIATYGPDNETSEASGRNHDDDEGDSDQEQLFAA